MWAIWAFHPNQAHNGYLETYLNLGIIGLVLILAVLVSCYSKACRAIQVNLDWGRFRLGFLVALIIYNWTEAAFKATHPLFFMLYLITLDLPGRGEEEEEEEEDEEPVPMEADEDFEQLENDGQRQGQLFRKQPELVRRIA